MPEVTTCPDCDKKLKVPDELVGKKVKCPGCSVMFTARADGAEDSSDDTPAPKTREKASPNGISTRKREAEDDERPRARSRRDEEEEDERPRAKSRREEEDDRPRAKSRREEDDEDDRSRGIRRRDDEDDRPSRRTREEDEDDRRRSRREDDDDHPRRRRSGSWGGTRIGVFLVIIANWLHLSSWGIGAIGVGTMLLMGGAVLSTIMGGANTGRVGEGEAAAAGGLAVLGVILLILTVGVYMIGKILQLVGQGLCIQVENGTLKGLAIAAAGCAVVALLFDFGGFFIGVRRGGNYAGSVSGLLNTASFICWCLFLRGVANELRDSDLAGKFLTYLIANIIFWVVAVILIIITACVGGAAMVGAASSGGNNAAGNAATTGGAMLVIMFLLGGIAALVYLGLTVWYVMLLQRLRALITQHMDRD